MNWLAHVYLSKPNIEFRLGNLLADLVKGKDRAEMSTAFQEGIRRHQLIDRFTDTHPVFHRSRSRIIGDFPHATGILVDIFYDHFLALDWQTYSTDPLDVFTTRLYADIRVCPIRLPGMAQGAIEYILSEDRLGAYRRLDGIETALRRLSKRIAMRVGRDLGLERGMDDLIANYDALRGDFADFFPQLLVNVGDSMPLPKPLQEYRERE